MAARTDIKIFIASSGELAEERKESELVIVELNKRYKHLHLEPILFEIDTPAGNNKFKQRIQDGINPKVEESHIAVILFYSKAGEFTIEEMELALKLDKKVFVYLKDGFIPKNREDLMKYDKVLELKDKMDAENKIRYQQYRNVTDYTHLLYKELEKYIDDTYPAAADKAEVTVSTSLQRIPLAPRPYLAHPYAIVKNFTGRREEMAKLTEWYKYDKEPMCIVEAIGGMGKSALTWKWLQDEVIATNAQVDGIIWWSFYDQGFGDFIHHLYEYCVPEYIRNLPTRIDETTEVIAALTNHRFLLVLDGFERVLRGYAQMMAMYIQEQGLSQQNIAAIKEAFDIHQRTPITPQAEKLLRALCTGNSKTLMTTRLYPATLEGLEGVKHIALTGLSKTDTIAFFKAEGIMGTDEEMIQAGKAYGFHPLMLKLLASAIKRSFSKDIKKALQDAFAKGLIDQREPQKILATSYKLLSTEEQRVVSAISVFRTAFPFDAAKALFPDIDADDLESTMMELCNLGFILYSDQQRLFDFHPILRSYLYDGLTGKDVVHQLALIYFTALPAKEKIATLADLEPAIEQYHHLLRAGRYDDAYDVFHQRLSDPLVFQIPQYELCINLCMQLFAQPSNPLPRVTKKRNQSSILNELSLCYANTGQLAKAKECLLRKLEIDLELKDDGNMGVGLANISLEVHIPSGALTATVVHASKAGELTKERYPFNKADSALILGGTFIFRAAKMELYKIAKGHLDAAMAYSMEEHIGLASLVAATYTRWTLGQVKNKTKDEDHLHTEALSWGLKAMEYADQFRILRYPFLNYFSEAYESIGRGLIAMRQHKRAEFPKTGKVFFYDEHFQNITDEMVLGSGNYTVLAERIVHEGLTLSRKMNQLYNECIFSLLMAQVEWLKIWDGQKEIEHFTVVEKVVKDADELARRIEYQMFLADLHLFCAELLTKLLQSKRGKIERLIGLTTKEHIAKVKEYAIDTSKYEDIFLPPDGSADEFYKGIEEYDMLKRGMTEEERIKKGYYNAWWRADELEKRIK